MTVLGSMPIVILADSALAGRPVAAAVAVTLWVGAGLVVAIVLGRRGHDLRYMAPLGVAGGPLLLGFVAANLRHHEASARPVIVREARALPGEERLLVTVIGDPSRIVDALPVLRLSADRLAQVEIARPTTYDAARASAGDADYDIAVQELEEAALFLDELGPGLVLCPGRGIEAVARYIDEREADVVMVVGDDDAQAALCRGSGRRTVAVMVGYQPDHAGTAR